MTNDNFVRLSPESSNIAKGAYVAETKELEITFNNGGVYIYSDVPVEIARAYKGTESVGKFFYAYIKGKFDYTKKS